MCGLMLHEQEVKKLLDLKVKDSKLLSPKEREILFGKIIEITDKYRIIITNPNEIDKAVYGNDGLNLNRLEAKICVEIINDLNPDKVIIDTPSNNIEAYKKFVLRFIAKKDIITLFEHKADFNYPIVSAASILAKVTRDNEIANIKKKINYDFGSGYMTDIKTVKFLEQHFKEHSDIFRKSWLPYKDIINKKFQKKLEDFSLFIEKIEKKDESMNEKLKRLEDFGYKFIPTKTIHESIRMKGPCTITLYKNGKLLIQGKEEHKKVISKLLK